MISKSFRTTCLMVVVALVFGCGGGKNVRDDFNKGLDAYKQGNFKTAFKQLRPFAEQGNAIAQKNLGFIIFNGLGVPKDYKLAVKWYRKSADQGNASAQSNLGLMYEKGHGVLKDYALAVKWYRKSADQGHAKAQSNLGVMYDNGWGVPKDYVLAYMWFNLSATNGDKDGQKNRDIVEKRMTPSQIEKAQDLAREWMEKHRQK